VLDPKVKELFIEQAGYYSLSGCSVGDSPLLKLFSLWQKNKKENELKIADFGGAGGQLLDVLAKKSNKGLKLYDVELVGSYKKHLANQDIVFVNKSILNAGFKNKYFDCIIIRDVLHHLIGFNLLDTQKNQERALLELKRMIRPGGLILIEELVTSSKISSRIIYALSKLNSKIGFKNKLLLISSNTVVSFLTVNDLNRLIEKVFDGQQIRTDKIPWNRELSSRLMHLGAKNWKMILAIRT